MNVSHSNNQYVNQHLLLLKTIHNGFVSRDKAAQLLEQGVAPSILANIESVRCRLLGGNDRKDERREFTRRMAHILDNQYNKAYNVLVYKEGHPVDITGIPYESTMAMGQERFGAWVYKYIIFNEGVVDNRGDGGHINWYMTGNFEDQGMHVVFHKRC